uniref:Uncharacterized protein n=1 Tax=Arundo donax TaxID=35708 RepID=A0A0A9JHZ8_ARUDO
MRRKGGLASASTQVRR